MDPLTVVNLWVGLVENLLKFISSRVKSVRIGPIELDFKKEVDKEFGATLARIAAAQSNLSEAIAAIDEIKTKYEAENKQLETLVEQVKQKRAEYQQTAADLTSAKELLAMDQDRIRRSLGVNDRRSKLVGFLSGVLASLIAALIWWAVPVLWQKALGQSQP